ncbi:hypothetical protein [Spirosoma utsteinense]|uniref:Uncharacterized protein n=1 Tax=Spirosoma utsteinense TaxID=2585773 RepID=A0ABR6WEU2_9BACT|nr:hypothetical protein [Spirosoma utsteinense]MBC3787450.1 hypothetical protein [Spirosoma utsteinense]MBC3794530.1 hypothetical protein [Spirosoma utsteinense]
MQPLTDLTKGLEVLEPFLTQCGFRFDNFENGSGSGGQFTVATYINVHKKFIIGYRYSIGELDYQFDKFKVGHTFYLDHLGCADKKQFPDFQSDDKLIAFKHILHDLYFLVDDFFVGNCSELIEASKRQHKFIKEHNEKAQEECNNQSDKIIIDRARQKFKDKDYKKTLELYLTVEHKKLLSEVDKKTIAYCERQI